MTYYKLEPDSRPFISLEDAERGPIESVDERLHLLAETRSVRDRWNPPPVKFGRYDYEGNRASRKRNPAAYESDAPNNGIGLALSAAAANALRDLWEEYGELLPLPSKGGEFYMFHCMNEIDAIDNINCQFSGSWIKRYALKPDVVRGHHLFRVSQPYKYSTIFASQAVVDRIRAAGLKGFAFEPVWSEEAGPYVAPPQPPPAEALEYGKGSRPMNKSERKDVVDKLVAEAKKALGIDLANDPAAKVLDSLRQAGVSARDSTSHFQELGGVGMVLGTLWGELVCRELGWDWAMVQLHSSEVPAVLSPTRSHVVIPHPWFYGLLTQSGRGPGSRELYEMIKADTLPEAQPDSLLILARG